MNWIEKIGHFFGNRLLKSEMQLARKTRVSNFGSAKSVALVYREKGESFFILVKQYLEYLKGEHGIREVMALAYIDDKKAVPYWQVHKLKFDFFTKSEINWKHEPQADSAKQFIENSYDILIDLEKEPSLPLQFIISRSKAAFKVGYYHNEREELYDLMLKTSDQTTFDQYINQVNHYLKRINTYDARA